MNGQSLDSKIKRLAHDQREARCEFIKKNVYPRLKELINKAQKRIKVPISFLSGNGSWFFHLTGHNNRNMDFLLTEAAGYVFDEQANPIVDRLRARFPELVEFCDIVALVMDELDEVVGDVTSGVKPKYKDKKGKQNGKRAR